MNTGFGQSCRGHPKPQQACLASREGWQQAVLRRLSADLGSQAPGRSVRAATQHVTSRAPARFSVAASSSRLVPVVITSSTSAMCCPRTSPEQANAPRRLRRRASCFSPIWGGVSRMRWQLLRSSGSPCRAATSRAISVAWLKPRSRMRTACRGMAIMRSGTGAVSVARVSHSPSAGAMASWPWYFRRGINRSSGKT